MAIYLISRVVSPLSMLHARSNPEAPASILASAEKGGVLTSPCRQDYSLRCLLMRGSGASKVWRNIRVIWLENRSVKTMTNRLFGHIDSQYWHGRIGSPWSHYPRCITRAQSQVKIGVSVTPPLIHNHFKKVFFDQSVNTDAKVYWCTYWY